MSDPAALTEALKARAAALGFSACGVADAAQPWPAAARLAEFLAAGRHGEMDWMAETADRRAHPQMLWPQAKSAIMLGLSYAPGFDPLTLLDDKITGAISAYAARRDYHEVIKGRLKQLGQWLARESGQGVKVFVDTAPLMEKPLAQRAGLGWQGKHTNLVSRAHGSWLLLGAILTQAPLAPDDPEADHCGTCRACLDICPTAAFVAPYQLDARRCLAYLSIEHKGPIPEEFRKPLGNRIFGCDDCLAVCPWNKFAAEASDYAHAYRHDLQAQDLGELAALDEATFRVRFAGTPIKRTGRDRFVRNVLIAIGNSGAPDLAPAAAARLDDDCAVVRGAAVWALRQLLDLEAFLRLKQTHAGHERDPAAAAEWAGA
jgi:epoxyqueuosine reductase